MAKFADHKYWEASTGEYITIDGDLPIVILGDYGYVKTLFITRNNKKINKLAITAGDVNHRIFISNKNEDPVYWHSHDITYFTYPTNILYLWIRVPAPTDIALLSKNISLTDYTITLGFATSDDLEDTDVYGVINSSQNYLSCALNNATLAVSDNVYVANTTGLVKGYNYGDIFSGAPDGLGKVITTGATTTAIVHISDFDIDTILLGRNVSGGSRITTLTKDLVTATNVSGASTNTKTLVDLVRYSYSGADNIALLATDGIYHGTVEGGYTFTQKTAVVINSQGRVFASNDGKNIRVWVNPSGTQGYRLSSNYGSTFGSITWNYTLKDAINIYGNLHTITDDNILRKFDSTETITTVKNLSSTGVTFQKIAFGFEYYVLFGVISSHPYFAIAKYDGDTDTAIGWRLIDCDYIKAFTTSSLYGSAITLARQMIFTDDRELLFETYPGGYLIKMNIDDLYDVVGGSII